MRGDLIGEREAGAAGKLGRLSHALTCLALKSGLPDQIS